MTGDWDSQPPKLGDPVDVPWLGPHYPPDAVTAGKTPSGPSDVFVALKRTLGRLGAWPWDPDGYDDKFSNAFSHGSSRGPGMAGLQRWARIQPTGWVGSATWDFLRRVLVQDGKPHAHEPAMDSYSQALIWDAERHPDPPPALSTRERALAGAVGDIGYTENPAGSNHNRYGEWYGMDYQPWCAMAVTYWYEVDGGGSPSFSRGAAFSYVPYVLNQAKAGSGGLTVTHDPIPGDLVIYDWGYDGVPDHIGLFESGDRSAWDAVEGNTSTSSNSNGGAVMRRQRRATDAAVTFVRVAEP